MRANSRLVRYLAGPAALLGLLACNDDWTITGLPSCAGERGPFLIEQSFAPARLEDPGAGSLVVLMKPDESVTLFVGDTFFERPPPPGGCDLVEVLQDPLRVAWRTSDPAVAVAGGDGSVLGTLRAVGPGEARISADVTVGGRTQRAELHYHCCRGSCPAVPPTCKRIPVDRIRVVR
jgi:hypothetical protein